MVVGKPWSFLHISRPEVDLPEDTDPYSPEVYAKGAENFDRMRSEGVLTQDDMPSLYVYRLTMGDHVQTGIVAAASIAAYDHHRIRRHELTRPKKEDDRVRQIEALNAQTGPVFLICSSDRTLGDVTSDFCGQPAQVDITADDGVRHELWVISGSRYIERVTDAFDAMPNIYVADGHHRSAAASRVAASRRNGRSENGGERPSDYFLAVIFPHDQVQILDYNRLVRDLNGMEKEGFLERISENFYVEPQGSPVRPAETGEFGMYLKGQWYRLRVDPARIPEDPVKRLDVSLLTHELIEPILGITDQRQDERIDFVGGVRGLEALQQRVDTGEMAVAFSLYPTTVNALMAVADAGQIMPPKSTWFEPKLADGLVSHLL